MFSNADNIKGWTLLKSSLPWYCQQSRHYKLCMPSIYLLDKFLLETLVSMQCLPKIISCIHTMIYFLTNSELRTWAWNCSKIEAEGKSGSFNEANWSTIVSRLRSPSSLNGSELLVAPMNAIRIRSERCLNRSEIIISLSLQKQTHIRTHLSIS